MIVLYLYSLISSRKHYFDDVALHLLSPDNFRPEICDVNVDSEVYFHFEVSVTERRVC